jgi:hypothetical protein
MSKKIDVKFEDGKLQLSGDTNQDGDKVIEIAVDMNEAVQEILKRGEPIEGAKVAEFDFSLSNLVVKLDSDRDGEMLLEFKLNLAELLEEVGLKL